MAPRKPSVEEALAAVSAPQDFPGDLQDLAVLDASLRCPICKDLFDSPVILAIPGCSHAFCSLCLRHSLSLSLTSQLGAAGSGGVGGSQRCPVCKVAGDEDKIRRVPALDETVVAWKAARSKVLELVQRAHTVQSTAAGASAGRKGGKRKSRGGSSEDGEFRCEPSEDDFQEKSNKRKTRRMPRDARSVDGTEAQRGLSSLKGKGKPSKLVDGSSDIELLDGDPSDPNVMAECPICGKQIRNSSADAHVMHCLSSRSKPSNSAWSKLGLGTQRPSPSTPSRPAPRANSGPNPDRPLPALNYSVMKTKDLRASLKSFGLPEKGGQEALVARLNYFAMLWNANLDADQKRRKGRDALTREVEAWEKRQAEAMKQAEKQEVGECKGKEEVEHERTYRVEFQRMIEEVKTRERNRKAQLLKEANEAEKGAGGAKVAQGPDVAMDDPQGPGAGQTAGDGAAVGARASDPGSPPRPPSGSASAAACPQGPSGPYGAPPRPTPRSPRRSRTPSSASASSFDSSDIPPLPPASPDPYEEALRRMGPYDGARMPAPSQDVGGRADGMGFSHEQGGGWKRRAGAGGEEHEGGEELGEHEGGWENLGA